MKILRHIHAVGYPYRGALTTLEKKNVRILDAEIVPDVRIINRDIGKVISSIFYIFLINSISYALIGKLINLKKYK